MEDSWHTALITATNSWNCKPARRSAWARRSHSCSTANNTSQSWEEPELLRAPEAAVAIPTASRPQNLACTCIPLKGNRQQGYWFPKNHRAVADRLSRYYRYSRQAVLYYAYSAQVTVESRRILKN